MQTQTKYEEMILQELRAFPEEAIPEVIHILRSVRKGIAITRRPEGKEAEPSGLCGIWKDDRSAAEIIEDIRSRRSGFGQRQVEL
jgi:hypothetical protein